MKPCKAPCKSWSLQRVFLLVLALLMIAAMIPSCSKGNSLQKWFGEGEEEGLAPVSGEFVTGPEVELARGTIPTAGGTITVDKPGDPLHGLTIEVPAGTYAEDRTFVISSATIESHTFGPALDPVTPLVYVDDGGGGAGKIMLASLPLELEAEEFAKGYLYDDETGYLEEAPTVETAESQTTSAFPHFSPLVWSKGSTMRLEELAKDGLLSGFRPGVDDWEFPNQGSVIAPNGHSMGQCQSAYWYYMSKKRGERAQSLYGLYDNNGGVKTPALWQDDSYGYRLASRLQVEKDWKEANKVFYRDDIKDREVWSDIANCIYETRNPVLLTVFPDDESFTGGLTLLAYRVEGDRVYVADPNFPGGSERYIRFKDGWFDPYVSGPTASDAEHNPTTYSFVRRSFSIASLDNALMNRLWLEFQQGVIGWDKFPGYGLMVYDEGQKKEVGINDSFQTNKEKLQILAYEDTENKRGALGVNVWREGAWLEAERDGKFPLKEGTNRLGILVTGSGSSGGAYLDFRWVEVEYSKAARKLETETSYYADNPQQVDIEYTYYEEDGQRVRHGYYRMYWSNGKLKADANYQDGLGHGPQKTYYENGQLQEEWGMKNGLEDGVHKYYTESGKLWREEVWVDNQRVSEKDY